MHQRRESGGESCGLFWSYIVFFCLDFFFALTSVMKSLKIGYHLSAGFSGFNPRDGRLASKQKAD